MFAPSSRHHEFLPEESAPMRAALRVLLDAAHMAQADGVPAWQYAEPLPSLQAFGLGACHLRWLFDKGYIRYADETGRGKGGTRRFRPARLLRLSSRTCVILTEAGTALARGTLLNHAGAAGTPPHAAAALETAPAPRWDREQRKLLWNNQLVKHFRGTASNQELILDAFQEAGWPSFIDDPLPPVPGCDAKERLHYTTRRLNGHQQGVRLRFRGNGRGDGLLWEPVGEAPQRAPSVLPLRPL